MAKLLKKKRFAWMLIIALLVMVITPMKSATEAASLAEVKDTISDSDLGVNADHEITFTHATFVPADGQIMITLDEAGQRFDLTGVTVGDIDWFVTSTSRTLGTSQSSTTDGVTIDNTNDYILIDMATDSAYAIATSATSTIRIGTNAIGGNNQINNPTSSGSYLIKIETKDQSDTLIDSAEAAIAIIEDVVVTATVSASLTFTIAGVIQSTSTNGVITTASTTATTIPFGTLTVGTSSIAAQDLTIATNASDGFTIIVFQDQNLTNAANDDIDCFQNGTCQTTPLAWTSPAGTIGQENTYGHFGITSEENSLGTNCANDDFGDNLWAGLSGTSSDEVMCHTGPADGVTAHIGATRVGFRVEITALQEAGDYTNSLTYIVTPTY